MVRAGEGREGVDDALEEEVPTFGLEWAFPGQDCAIEIKYVRNHN